MLKRETHAGGVRLGRYVWVPLLSSSASRRRPRAAALKGGVSDDFFLGCTEHTLHVCPEGLDLFTFESMYLNLLVWLETLQNAAGFQVDCGELISKLLHEHSP